MSKKRQVKKFYKAKHGKAARQVKKAPATDKQVALLAACGVSRTKATKMSRGEASVVISKNQRKLRKAGLL